MREDSNTSQHIQYIYILYAINVLNMYISCTYTAHKDGQLMRSGVGRNTFCTLDNIYMYISV